MPQRDNILQELNELESSLTNISPSNIYSIPTGYFDSLAGQVIGRIRAMETSRPDEELSYLSTVVAGISKSNPYQVPVGYFEGLGKKTLELITREEIYQTPTEELEGLSPLLSGLKKQVPYSVPENYFDNLTANGKKEEPKAKVISLTNRKWFRYAAAAMIVGIITMSGFLLFNKKEIDPSNTSYAWVKKNMNKVSTDDLNKFIDSTAEETPMIASINTQTEVKELVKNIPDKEIQDFLDDTQDAEPDSNDNTLLN